MQSILGLAIGIAFGYALQRSSVAQCSCIRGAMALQDFHMLKLLMTAVAVGMIITFPLSGLGIVHFSVKATYVAGVGLGGLIFGVGMALAGFCPGTVLAALPQGGKNIWWTLAGALAGSFAYSLVYGSLQPWLIEPLNYGKLTVPEVLGTNPTVTAITIGALILIGLVAFDRATARGKLQPNLPDLANMGRPNVGRLGIPTHNSHSHHNPKGAPVNDGGALCLIRSGSGRPRSDLAPPH